MFLFLDLFNASNHTGITEVVCYGIGRVSEDITAQYQLAVLLGLADKLTVSNNNIQLLVLIVFI